MGVFEQDMLNPFNLQLFPSCYNCLSWSADGELAVAAGEYLYILVGDFVSHLTSWISVVSMN